MNRVHAATQYCFGAISQIRRLDPSDLPLPELLHQRLSGFVEEMRALLRKSGFDNQDVEDITYAVVALADEVALNSGELISSYWMTSLLQFKYFRENTAGDGFFNRLEIVRRDPSRKDVLEVFTLCLLFGFQGKYRIRGGELELMTLAESVKREALRPAINTELLSPHGERPTEAIVGVRRNGVLVLAAAAAVAIAVLLYGGLRLSLASSLSTITEEMANSSQRTAKP
jgi:type VI secretion system protein ImpK